MASVIYNSFKKEILDTINIDAVTVKVMLVTSAYTPNIDTHTRRSSVTNEVAGSGYTTGGATLTGVAITQNNTTDKGVFDANDITWSSSTITARGAVIYVSTGVAANDNLIAYIDFGTDKVSDNGDFTIQWNASGIITLG